MRFYLVSNASLEARTLALELMAHHRLQGWFFRFNDSCRFQGRCFFPTSKRPGRIELSVHLCEFNSLDIVRDTILHEIAHALAGPEAGHGRRWVETCRQIGARPEPLGDACMPAPRWESICPRCDRVFRRYSRIRSCRRCREKLTWRRISA